MFNGSLLKTNGEWTLQLEPHAALWAKRIFPRISPSASGQLILSDTPAVCRDLEWFCQRFPLETSDGEYLAARSRAHVEHCATLDRIAGSKHVPRKFRLGLPPRAYQRRAAELYLTNRSLLLADEVGIGKTVSAICSFTESKAMPAVVVCLAHLPRQWEREINRFAPELRTHIVKKSEPYELPKWFGAGPDVLIISYHKLVGWQHVLARYCKSIVFDEAQELRRHESQKHQASKSIAEAMNYRLGLSATPIYNFGGEIFNLLDVLSPGSLGSRSEFFQEWCTDYGGRNNARLKNPEAFGAWLKEQHLMLRRTRKDVGRELPDLMRVTHEVDSDPAALKQIEGRAGELARILLAEGGQRGEKMHAAEEFSNTLRQATGIAKAPYVAEFTRLLIESGESVVLFGWHRAVYEIWREKLSDLRPQFYTGSESASAKQTAAQKFIDGDTNLFIMSLRAGAGVDGLQKRCRTVVLGEIDWSPGVHEQCIGRIYRDGQPDKVAAYFLISEDGIDPMMAEVLGLKSSQIEGIRGDVAQLVQRDQSADAIKRLAAEYLDKGTRRLTKTG